MDARLSGPEANENSSATGIAALADAPVDPISVARVMAAVACVCALCTWGLWWRASVRWDSEPDGGVMLRALATPVSAVPGHGSLIVLMVDGLRAQHLAALPAWSRFSQQGLSGTTRWSSPSSRPMFFHTLFTGVPSSASGVRSPWFAGAIRQDSLFDRARASGTQIHTIVYGEPPWMPLFDGGDDVVAETPTSDLLSRNIRTEGASSNGILWLCSDQRVSEVLVQVPSSEVVARSLSRLNQEIEMLAERTDEDTSVLVLSTLGVDLMSPWEGEGTGFSGAPFLLLSSRLRPPSDDVVLPLEAWASVWAELLQISPPSAVTEPVPSWFQTTVSPPADVLMHRALVRSGVRSAERARRRSRLWWMLALFGFGIFTLGPIKRAFGFERSVAVAVGLAPCVLIGALLLSHWLGTEPSADARWGHVLYASGIGAVSSILVVLLAGRVCRDVHGVGGLRAFATVAWAYQILGGLALAWCGGALGPWGLDDLSTYSALSVPVASAAGMLVMALGLWLHASRMGARSRASQSPATS